MVVSIQVNLDDNTAMLRHLTIQIDNSHIIYTTITSDAVIASHWIDDTLELHQDEYRSNRLIIGLGVQWTPLYPDDDPKPEPVATIKLCVNNRCLIYHLYHTNVCTPNLQLLLNSPRITFVSLWSHNYTEKLLASRHSLRLCCNMPIDLRFHVRDHDGFPLHNASVSDIATEILGVDLWNLQELGHSHWEVKHLSTDQVCHACVRAYFSYAIGIIVQAWKFNRNIIKCNSKRRQFLH